MNQIIALKGVSPGSSTAYAAPSRTRDAAITTEIRPLSACGEIRQAWTELAARAIEPNLFFEPDFALAAAQHLIAFRDVAVLLAWQGPAGSPQRRLLGLIPCFPRNRLFVPDELIGFSDPRILNGAPLLDAAQAQAVLAAVLSLRQGWVLEGRGLVLRRIDMASPLIAPIRRAAEALRLNATLSPANLPLPRRHGAATPSDIEAMQHALARRGKLELVEATSRAELRDAVEILLAMEASGPAGRAGKAVLQDTREVGFLRAMTRALARSRRTRVALLTLDGRPIAGALVIGRAKDGLLYMTARDESEAPFFPGQVLLALMQQAAPERTILQPLPPASGPAAVGFGEVRLAPRVARKPRDLAGRARAALRRGLRLPPARAAG
ncbi:GNAT family N-acetyltransferase [Bosea psychrotolerans]|uniref:CelD/BcsL family acetyltransferase involved in cellulose biosynthesis n=1 Tax=Bosea psychrotolerans TaxID=1871628 RepID=A0A2S4M5X8_9HYPH|nr:GNAT family N-acetyltransferase [Bosea psychrotolerans]POR50027.1 CelD/BcsL family acetyltransferase involved in cellulose biosynthesis [Bosea psychrotolerans]